MEEVIKLNAVDQYNKMFGLETLHPLVSVVDLSEATGYPRHFTLNYGVYALFLKNTKCGDIRYGRQFYDYQEGTVTSFAPGQVTEVNMLEGMQPSASGLLFHPDLIKGTSLGQGIKQYSFFSYSSTEALHLSEDEKEIFLDCLKKIKMEIQRPIDKHSKGLIARNIELLLDYCMRFYERQFITRSAAKRKNALGENVIIQSIGACSGVIVAGAIFTLPALYILQVKYPEMTVSFMQVFISSLLGGVLGILFLIPFRKYFVSDMHGKYPFPEATATTQVLVSGEKSGSQAKPLLMAGMIGGLYDFIVATFGWWNENFTTRVCGAGEMLAEKAKLVFKVNTGAAVLGLGYIVGLKYASIICAGCCTSVWILFVILRKTNNNT